MFFFAPNDTKFVGNDVAFGVMKDGKLYLSKDYVKIVSQEEIFRLIIEIEEKSESKLKVRPMR